MIGKLLFFLVGLPILDLILMVRAGMRMGPWAFAIVVGSGLIGLWLYKYYGSKLWIQAKSGHFEINDKSSRSFWRPMTRWLAGLLLIFPGFLTDVLGVVLLLPGAHKMLGQSFLNWLGKRFQTSRNHRRPEPNSRQDGPHNKKPPKGEIKADWRIIDKQDIQ